LRILFITTDENNNLKAIDRAQGDYFENMALIGLRKFLGKDCVDYPRKRILYGDFSSVPKSSLHGQGFSLYHEVIQDISEEDRDLSKPFDVILYGTVMSWNMKEIPELESRCKVKFYIDGNDLYGIAQNNKYIFFRGEVLIGNQRSPSFKGQIIEEEDEIFPIGVGLPESRILPIDFSIKNKLYQSAYPRYALFEPVKEEKRAHHLFTDETQYYNDMATSWFGLSCKRGGWDAMRHYEIIAAGSVILYRDYDQKPRFCAPGDMPAITYSSREELESLLSKLIIDNQPTQNYIDILNEQREWLIKNGTVEARTKYMLGVLETHVNK